MGFFIFTEKPTQQAAISGLSSKQIYPLIIAYLTLKVNGQKVPKNKDFLENLGLLYSHLIRNS